MEHEQTKILNEMKMIEMKAMREEDVEVMEDGSQSGEVEAPKKGYGHNLYKHVEEEHLAYRTKKYGDSMRHVLPKMPIENVELPQFFETVEKLFEIYEVPDDIKAKLLIPLLTAQAKSLVNRMSVHKMGDFAELKKFLLAEYKLTPREYKHRLVSAAKNTDETHILFS